MRYASKRPPTWRIAAAAAAAAIALSACSSGSVDDTDGRNEGGESVVNYALPPNASPNWILPIVMPGKLSTRNGSINDSLWPPKVTYSGSLGDVEMVAPRTMAI